jgi:hypothetical protein
MRASVFPLARQFISERNNHLRMKSHLPLQTGIPGNIDGVEVALLDEEESQSRQR